MLDLNGATEFGQFVPIAAVIALFLAWSMREKPRSPRSGPRRRAIDKKPESR